MEFHSFSLIQQLADESRKAAIRQGTEYDGDERQEYTDVVGDYNPIRNPQGWSDERDQSYTDDKTDLDDDEKLREKITSIVSELLDRNDGEDEYDKMEGVPGRKSLPRIKPDLKDISQRLDGNGHWGQFVKPTPDTRLPLRPEGPTYEKRVSGTLYGREGTTYDRYPGYDARNTERSSTDQPRSRESSEVERSLHMRPEYTGTDSQQR